MKKNARDTRKTEQMIGASISSAREKGRTKAMGGGMMMKRPGMKKGSIPPQLKKFVMAKKKKAKMKKKAKA